VVLLDSGLSRDASDTGHTEGEEGSEVCSTSSEEIPGKDCGAPNQKTAAGYSRFSEYLTVKKRSTCENQKLDSFLTVVNSASSGIDKSDEDSLGVKSSRNEPPPILHRAKTFTEGWNW